MGGIISVINLNDAAQRIGKREIKELDNALEMQAHRGPDGNGACAFCYQEGAEAFLAETASAFLGEKRFDGILGCNRFAVRKEPVAAENPFFFYAGKALIAFDGELYNREELLSHIKEKNDAPVSDEQIILYLYDMYGVAKTLSMLNGMFALVIIDLKKRMWFAARDRLGIKPVYVTLSNNRLLLCSELKSFTCFNYFKRELDYDAYNARLIFSRPGDRVLLKNVAMIEPGTYIGAVFNGEVKTQKYFDIDKYERKNSYTSVEAACMDLSDILSETIKRYVEFDVPFATQVSGGIDSTLVNYYLHELQGSKNINGISIVDGGGELGEEYWIDKVGKEFNIHLHKCQLDATFFTENYKKIVWHNDAPIYKPYFASFYKMAQSAKCIAKVLLSGEGADETAGGYGRFAAGAFFPFFCKNAIKGKNIVPYASYAAYAVHSDSTVKDFTICGYNNAEALLEEEIARFSRFSGSNFDKQIKYETSCRLPESFMRQEKMAAACSLEIRVPLADNAILDFLMQLPENLLLAFAAKSPVDLPEDPFAWVQGKYIYKELCAKKLGRDFAYRKKQIVVFDEKNILQSAAFSAMFYEEILPAMRQSGLVETEKVKKYYENLGCITKNEFNSMWRAISLQTWCDLFL